MRGTFQDLRSEYRRIIDSERQRLLRSKRVLREEIGVSRMNEGMVGGMVGKGYWQTRSGKQEQHRPFLVDE